MMKRTVGILCLVFLTCHGLSQEMPGELSLLPPAHSQWSIKYSKTDEGAAAGQPQTHPAATLVEADYEITDNIAHLTQIFSDGTRKRTYIVQNMAFSDDLENKEIKALPLNTDLNAHVGFTRVYPGFEWVRKSDYVETITKGDTHLLHFREGGAASVSESPATASPSPNRAPSRVGREAWIDAGTGLPAYFQEGRRVGTYHFEPPPAGRISLPPAFETARQLYFGH